MTQALATHTGTAEGFALSELPLTVLLKVEAAGEPLTRERVTAADLAQPMSEAWRECFLRKGAVQIPFHDVNFRLLPILRQDRPDRCKGYVLQAQAPGAAGGECGFTTRSLGHVAQRAAQRLVQLGALTADRPYFYELAFQPRSSPAPNRDEGPEAVLKSPPLHVLSVPLPFLQEQAKSVKPDEPAGFRIFYTAQALAQAEACSRQGQKAHPPVESGGFVLGCLASCPESGELVCIACQILEAHDAEQGEFSLSFTGQTWSRVQTVLRARQVTQPSWRILATVHGHNFLPGQPCEDCRTRPICNFSSVWPSQQDKVFTEAVFARQPWTFLHIFGLTARSDKVDEIYCSHDGRLERHGYHVLPDFQPQQWPLPTSAPLAQPGTLP